MSVTVVDLSQPRHRVSFNPYVLMVASMGFGTVSLGDINGANIRLWQIFLCATLVAWVIKNLFKARKVAVNKSAIVMVSAIVTSVLLSGMSAVDLYLYLKQMLLLIFMLVLFLVVAQGHDACDLTQILRWLIYPGILIAGWGLIEFISYPESLQNYSSTMGLLPRARSFFVEANEFSQYLTVPFGFVLAMLSYFDPLKRLERVVLRLGVVVIIVAQVLSFSRGGIFSFAAQILVWWLLAARFNRNILSSGKIIKIIVIILSALIVLYIINADLFDIMYVLIERIQSLLSVDDPTTLTRLVTIFLGLEAASASWSTLLFGIGFGNLPVVLGEGVANSGNMLVDIFAEMGLVGLLVSIWFIGACLVLPLKVQTHLIRIHDMKLLTVFYAAYLSFVGLIAGGMTSPTFMLNIFWFCGGLLMSLHHFGNKLRARNVFLSPN